MNNQIQKYQIFNPEKENCPICACINNLYQTDSFQNEVKLPDETGKGYYRKIIVGPSKVISISDMTFSEKITMAESRSIPQYCLAFCLGDALRWQVEGNKTEYEINFGESYIFSGNLGKSVCSYLPGQRFFGLNIQLSPEIIINLLRYLGKEYSTAGLPGFKDVFNKRKFTASVSRIIHEILDCRYRDDVKRIYLEGKVLELIAVYLDESILEQKSSNLSTRLSFNDMEALRQAKSILDKNFTDPPTISKLARLICLNEYKLKIGFKELFGIPVHAYIIEKRLEMARVIMEEQRLSVTEAAFRVGYSDLSHFAEKFRRKFGINPSEYKKS